MDKRPIGVFDSGVGGLTTVRALRQALPGEDIVYFGDTGRVPYGTRSSGTIRKYAAQDIRYLLKQNVKAIVAACGTVSTNVDDGEAVAFGVAVPYTGVVVPSARTACEVSATGRIGVIATSASIRTGAYERAVRAVRPEAEVFGQACPLLVPLVENGMIQRDNQITRLTLEMYLAVLREKNIDTLILGCTHFPLLYDIINDILEYRVTLIDSGAAAARRIAELLRCGNALHDRADGGGIVYHVTDTVEGFAGVARYFLKDDVAASTHFVDLESLGG